MSGTPAHWLPRQHGAWAMLTVPALVGALRSGPSWPHLLLAALWFAGYFAFNAGGLAVKAPARRRPPVVMAVVTYGALTAALGLVVLLTAPRLVVWAPAYLPLAAVSLVYSRRRNDRSLVNDGVTILAACLFGAVMYDVGTLAPDPVTAGWHHGWQVMAWVVVALFAYFFGTALYVKTLIRERTNAAYHRLSVGYHAAWTLFWAASGSVGVPVGPATRAGLTAFFAVLTVRAAVLAGRRVRPMIVGLGEIGACVVLAALLVTW